MQHDTPAKGRILRHEALTWVDVENPSREVFSRLESDYGLHPVHLNESVQKIQHNRVEREDNYLFFVLHFPIFDTASRKILVAQVGIFLGKDFMVTIRTAGSEVIDHLFDECHKAGKHSDDDLGQGPAYLLYILTGLLLDNISDMTEAVVSELDEIEDLVFDNNGSDALRIGKIRQKIVRLRRVIGPKRFVLEDLTQQIDSFADHSMHKYYSNNAKTVNKLWEVIEEAKETVEIFKDADFTTSTEQTNRTLAVLTLIFTFTIPITVAGTLYGMNVPLPGGIEAGSWTFLGAFTTFGIIVAASSVMAVLMYLYFRSKQWF